MFVIKYLSNMMLSKNLRLYENSGRCLFEHSIQLQKTVLFESNLVKSYIKDAKYNSVTSNILIQQN